MTKRSNFERGRMVNARSLSSSASHLKSRAGAINRAMRRSLEIDPKTVTEPTRSFNSAT